MKIDLNALNPYVRFASQSILKGGWKIARRIIFDYEIIYIESGSLLFTYDNHEYRINKGQFIFIRPKIPHSFNVAWGDVSQPHVHFDMFYNAFSTENPISFKDADAYTQNQLKKAQNDVFADYSPAPTVNFADTPKAKKLLFEIIGYYKNGDVLNAKATLGHLIAMLINDNFCEILSAASDNEPTVASRIKDFIDAGQCHNMTLDNFEKYFFFSKYYLEKRFKEEFGTGIIAYRNRIRLQYAAAMLKTQGVCKTAEALGFSSVYVFSRAFKNAYGVSPDTFRNKEK
ncbi:MAG: AraC family transcriptional regulator [Oscillospiraceae bacterium]|nr:AraC family transcriptional regulator [Candidatus Equicaccousia limihippi]